jgi:hypothetical protein
MAQGMNRRQIVLEMLSKVALALEPELPHIVFVGGAIVVLYDIPPAFDVRLTEDVDCVADVSRPDYYALLERLRKAGFKPSSEPGDPVCRLRHPPDLVLDVMPADASIIGFSNRWYAEALSAAQEYRLPNGLVVKAIAPVHFLATKLEAFRGRGQGDYLMSHDMEDVITVLAAYPELLETLQGAQSGAAAYVREELQQLGRDRRFLSSLPGCLPPDDASQARVGPLIEALQRLAQRADA